MSQMFAVAKLASMTYEGEARMVLAARNRIGWIRNKQPQAVCWDFHKCSDLNYSNRPVRTRMPGGVGGVGQLAGRPYPD
jgi:hypothetical protein